MAIRRTRRSVRLFGIVYWIAAIALVAVLFQHYAGITPAVIACIAAWAAFRVFRIAVSPYDPNPVILPGASDLHDDQGWVP